MSDSKNPTTLTDIPVGVAIAFRSLAADSNVWRVGYCQYRILPSISSSRGKR
jgi:hypothetical protein